MDQSSLNKSGATNSTNRSDVFQSVSLNEDLRSTLLSQSLLMNNQQQQQMQNKNNSQEDEFLSPIPASWDSPESPAIVSTQNNIPISTIQKNNHNNNFGSNNINNINAQPPISFPSNQHLKPSINQGNGNGNATQPQPGFRPEVYHLEQDQRSASSNSTSYTFGSHSTSSGISPPLLAICAYFFLILGAFALVFTEKKNLFVIFHAWQSLVCGVFLFILQLICLWNDTLYMLSWVIYLIFTAVMIAIVIRDSPSQKLSTMIPYVSVFCAQRAENSLRKHSANSDNYNRMYV